MSDLLGVVVAHEDLALGLVGAVEGISGVTDALVAISNRGLGPDQLRGRIEQEIEGRPSVVFVDLGGGSCGLAGLGLAKTRQDVACVTGVNVPMLLDFVFHRDMPFSELLPRLLDRGQAAQRAHHPSLDES